VNDFSALGQSAVVAPPATVDVVFRKSECTVTEEKSDLRGGSEDLRGKMEVNNTLILSMIDRGRSKDVFKV
jgi:hypothetical protein